MRTNFVAVVAAACLGAAVVAVTQWNASAFGCAERPRTAVTCIRSNSLNEELYIKSWTWGRNGGERIVAISASPERRCRLDTLSEYVFYDENAPVIFQCFGDTIILNVGIPIPAPKQMKTEFTIIQRRPGSLEERLATEKAFSRRMRSTYDESWCEE